MCEYRFYCSPNRTPTIAQSALPGVTPLAALRAERCVVQALQRSLAKHRNTNNNNNSTNNNNNNNHNNERLVDNDDDTLFGELDVNAPTTSGIAASRASALSVPMVRVGYGGQWLDVPPTAVALWDRLLLEPFSFRKDIVYYVICPNNAFIRAHCETFFRELTVTYQRHSLGSHQPASGNGGGGSSSDGLVMVPLVASSSRAAYARAVQSVCASIVDDLNRCSAAFVQTCTVVYVIDPFVPGVSGAQLQQQQQQQRHRRATSASNTTTTTPTPSSAPQSASTRNTADDTADDSEPPSIPDDAQWMRMLCDATSALAAHDERQPIHNVTTTLIALSDVVRSTALAATLRDIAFGVSSAARRILLDSPIASRPINALSPIDWQKRRLFEPLFVIARSSSSSSIASTSHSQPSTPLSVIINSGADNRRRADEEGVARDAVHCCYVMDADRLWACVTDANGELLETIVLPCVTRGAVEARSRALARRRDAFANLWRAMVALLAMRTPTATRSLVLCALGTVDDLPVGSSSSSSASSSSSSLLSSSSSSHLIVAESSTVEDNSLRGDDQLLWHEILNDEESSMMTGAVKPFNDVCLVALQADRRSFAYALSKYNA